MTMCAGFKADSSIRVVDDKVAVLVHDTKRAAPGSLTGDVRVQRPDLGGVEFHDVWCVCHDIPHVVGKLVFVDAVQHEVSIRLHEQPESTQCGKKTVATAKAPAGFEVLGQVNGLSLFLLRHGERGGAGTPTSVAPD